MTQGALLQLTMSMQSGQCVNIDREEFMEAVKGELDGVDRLFPARATDAELFIQKISRNWEVEITVNHEKGTYLIRKC